jgi:ketosteroid isomerase-like protein
MRPFTRGAGFVFLALFLLVALSGGASRAQQKEKKKKHSAQAAGGADTPMLLETDEQQINYLISEVLGAWQIGDTERMHKDYADDVSVVRGDLEPPILGWAAYEQRYQQQRAGMQQVRLDRSKNAYIKVNGTTAWACYQWEFAAVIGGAPSVARGQTTYVLVKKQNRWLIAHDHTSVVQTMQQPSPGAPPAGPASPPKPAR